MEKVRIFIVAFLLVLFIVWMSACSNSSADTNAISNESESNEEVEIADTTSDSKGSTTESINKSDNSADTPSDSISIEQPNDTDKEVSTNTINKNIQGDNTTNTLTKVDGRTEFLEKLQNIQKELDALPEKKDSDKGITNAMKNYYGISYEKYDQALNDIYDFLQKELSPEKMNELKYKQINWIEEKENKANEERKNYEGGTFENVAYYISLYESTKERCYELVNEYMTD
ncbi:lysozyme inhibitor LprI family protein [Siminovitchia sediminis]|uniref:Lysozyme inhibitor LprI family protein n=1 Tax=Siminovitchia sediminis TaxID=1274353 RepID=A0ABW4KEX3_9BACI